MSNKGNLHEQGFNYALAAALRKCFPAWSTDGYISAERAGAGDYGGRRIDISVDIPDMPRVAVECAYGGDDGKDAANRIADEGIRLDTAISVNIPPAFQGMTEQQAETALDAGAQIGYAVLQRGGYRFPRPGYITGGVRDLAAFMQVASVSKDSVEEVADEVVGRINRAAATLAAGLPATDIADISARMSQRSTLTGMRTIAVLWLDALLVQNMIRRANPAIAKLPLHTETVRPQSLVKEWRKILETNWRSIFEPAVVALERAAASYDKCIGEALRALLEGVEILNSARLGSHINVGAELFPKISEDRKQAAAFYTMPSTAELLAALTIEARDRGRGDWRDPDLFKRMKIADLACGTGTLLRAGLHRVAMLHTANGGDADSLGVLYRDSMESGLTGADVSPIASHLSVSSLVLEGSGQKYSTSNIGWVGVGHKTASRLGGLSTGSLEFFVKSDTADVFSTHETVHHGKKEQTPRTWIKAEDASFDYILMNPPYSRTRKGQSAFDIAGLSGDQRKGCQKRWSKLTADQPADKRAGMAASFLCLARNKVKPGGKIGFVLPLTAAFAQSWDKTREMLVTEFENILAVAVPGGSAGAKNMSADTHMGEMLLTATRKKTETENISPVLCIALDKLPGRCGEAGEVGRAIMQAVQTLTDSHCQVFAGAAEIGRIARFEPAQASSPWSHLSAHNAELGVVASKLASGVLEDLATQQQTKLNCPFTTLDKLFTVGPTHHRIGHMRGGDPIGAFVLDKIQNENDALGRNRALWVANAKTQTALRVLPTHKGVVADQKAAAAIVDKRGTLHYARGLRWTSQKLVAATTPHPVYGGAAWTTLQADDENLLRAFALWANSTLGAVVHWTRGSRTQQGRAGVQVNAIKQIPCPDLRQLPPPRLAAAAAAFDRLAARQLLPVCQLHADPARHEIDQAVMEMLDLPPAPATLAPLRRLWCAEPSVHGGNAQALVMLNSQKQ
ncbi:MAG: hypothetical protein OXU29_01955 [Gammaproteobacteria bacterium]|nr:hypothetical protein [Gammaproteobacteria bacterium]